MDILVGWGRLSLGFVVPIYNKELGGNLTKILTFIRPRLKLAMIVDRRGH